jgi:hypothetical protein
VDHLSTGKFEEYDNLIYRVLFGTKDLRRQVAGLTPIHVLTAVQKLERSFEGVERTYDELSEVAHPNGESLFSFAEPADVFDTTLDLVRFTEERLGLILQGLRIDIAEACLADSERLVELVIKTWKEQHASTTAG